MELYLVSNDYMRTEAYDLLDAILAASGFVDDGPTGLPDMDHAVRKYSIGTTDYIPSCFDSEYPVPGNSAAITFFAHNFSEEDEYKLSEYGFVLGVPIPDFPWPGLTQGHIHHRSLPRAAKMAKHPIRPTKRIIEEASYYKWTERMEHGHDLEHWLTSEWEEEERLKDILKRLS